METVDFRACIHPREYSRFIIAMIFAVPLALLALALVLVTFGLLLIYVALILLFVWIGFGVLYASFVANSIRVSEKNYPRLLELKEEMRDKIGVKKSKKIEMFVYEQGSFNAYFKGMFTRRAIFVNSELLDQGVSDDELRWLIGRFLGKIRSRQRLGVLGWILTLAERLIIFNLFLLPYERATAYTGDRVALAAIGGDLNAAVSAMNKLLVGRSLGYSVNPAGIVDQHRWVRGSLFAFLARLPSNLPHALPRYVDLIGFARQKYPERYQQFVAENPSFQTLAPPTAPTASSPATSSTPAPRRTTTEPDALEGAGSDVWLWGVAPVVILTVLGALHALRGVFGLDAPMLRFAINGVVFAIAAIAALLALRGRPPIRQLSAGGAALAALATIVTAILVGLIQVASDPSNLGALIRGDFDPDFSYIGSDSFALAALSSFFVYLLFMEAALRGVFLGGQLRTGTSAWAAVPLAAFLGAVGEFLSQAFWIVPELFQHLTDPWMADLPVTTLLRIWLVYPAVLFAIGLVSGLLRVLTARAWPSIIAVCTGGLLANVLLWAI